MNLGFSPAQWQRLGEDYEAWWRGELDRPLIWLVIERPSEEFAGWNFLPNWPDGLSPGEIVERVVRRMSSSHLYGDAFPYFFVNYGAGVAAAFAGAELNSTPDTVWFHPPERHELEDLHIALDPGNAWWKRVQDVTRVLAEEIGDRIQISFTDIGGNLDILASLRGTNELLVDIARRPDDVARSCQEVTHLWLEAYDALYEIIAPHSPGTTAWAPIWAPGKTYMLQSDFSYMISPEMFGEFVIPDLRACCDHLEYAFYHMDGVGQIPHLDQLLAIENLYGIQWIPGEGKPPACEWPEVLSKIREAGKLCQVAVDPQGALDIVRRHGGKGFHLWIDSRAMSNADAERFMADIGRG